MVFQLLTGGRQWFLRAYLYAGQGPLRWLLALSRATAQPLSLRETASHLAFGFCPPFGKVLLGTDLLLSLVKAVPAAEGSDEEATGDSVERQPVFFPRPRAQAPSAAGQRPLVPVAAVPAASGPLSLKTLESLIDHAWPATVPRHYSHKQRRFVYAPQVVRQYAAPHSLAPPDATPGALLGVLSERLDRQLAATRAPAGEPRPASVTGNDQAMVSAARAAARSGTERTVDVSVDAEMSAEAGGFAAALLSQAYRQVVQANAPADDRLSSLLVRAAADGFEADAPRWPVGGGWQPAVTAGDDQAAVEDATMLRALMAAHNRETGLYRLGNGDPRSAPPPTLPLTVPSTSMLATMPAATVLRELLNAWSPPARQQHPTVRLGFADETTAVAAPGSAPAVQNTFNVTVHAANGGSSVEDEADMADRIARILADQARRYGIDVA